MKSKHEQSCKSTTFAFNIPVHWHTHTQKNSTYNTKHEGHMRVILKVSSVRDPQSAVVCLSTTSSFIVSNSQTTMWTSCLSGGGSEFLTHISLMSTGNCGHRQTCQCSSKAQACRVKVDLKACKYLMEHSDEEQNKGRGDFFWGPAYDPRWESHRYHETRSNPQATATSTAHACSNRLILIRHRALLTSTSNLPHLWHGP